MNIRDSVVSSKNKVGNEALLLSKEVKNKLNSLNLRLEAFEDIMSLEVGDTTLLRSRMLEREFNLRQLYIKFEGDNPTGTQKDRIAFQQVYDAIRRGYDRISLATCGNFGVAVALAAELGGVACQIYIPKTYHSKRIKEMEELNASIFRLEGNYEDVVAQSSFIAKEHDWYDANPGALNSPIQISAYAQIAYEIFDELGDAPKYCATPVSNGTLLAGLYRGFASLYKRGKTSRIPRMIAASSTNKNPIVHSFIHNLNHCQDLDPKKIKETAFNEPLINWHSFDGDEALTAIQKTDGNAYNISDKNLKEMSALLLKKESHKFLPASTAGLIGLLRWHAETPFEPDRFVAVVTAKC